MLKSLKALGLVVGLVAGVTLSNLAYALGMGGINVTTALGQPLQAEIELVAVGKAEKNSLFARLATPEVYKSAGMDYPETLPKIKFQIETRPNGDSYLSVTSALPVNDPFVNLLVELSWNTGRLLREYTFLLDPPGFKAEVEAAPVQPILSQVESAPAPVDAPAPNTAISRPPLTLPRETEPPKAADLVEQPQPRSKRVAKENTATPAKKSREEAPTYGVVTVQRGDTLGEIANQERAPDISLERMLVALYRANTDVFDGKNMNRLRTGKILRLPEESEINKISQADAVREVRAQATDWQAYRQQLAAASGSITESAPRQEASGKIGARITEAAPPVNNPGKEVVRLSKGEAPGDKAAGGDDKTRKLQTLEEEAIAKNKQIKEGNARVALLEKNIKDMQRLIELKSQSLPPAPSTAPPAPSKAMPTPPPPVVSTPQSARVAQQQSSVAAAPVFQQLNSASAASSAAAAGAAASAAKPATPIKPSSAARDSFVSQLLESPLYLAAGAMLLGLLTLLLLRMRRGKGGKVLASNTGGGEEAGNARISAPIVPSPDTGDFTGNAVAAPSANIIESADVDPITEADLFLNFGRDGQAEEILKDALQKNPGNQQIRLKLLSIYAKRKDAATFATLAAEVQDSGDVAAWLLAAEMGRKLDPENALYGGVQAAAEPGAPEVTGEPAQPASLDFDLGFDEPATASATGELPEPTAQSGSVDFDLGFAPQETADHDATVVLDAPVDGAPASAEVDFNLVQEIPVQADAPAADFENTIVLDEPLPADPAPVQATPIPETPVAEVAAAQNPDTHQRDAEQHEIAAADLDDLIFEVSYPEIEKPITEAEKPDENANAMAFMLDFPIEETAPVATTSAVPVSDNESFSLSDINLNLDVPAAPAEEVKDANWYDVATKLDLARAYQEMGDAAGAREILQEVLTDGDAEQRATAEAMLRQLPA
ncbi:MAG: FimV/HubP family polar landmark protein [Pseudomonadota bacterium]